MTPPLLGLILVLVWNLARGLSGKSTICSGTRQWVPRWLFRIGWPIFDAWFTRHWDNPAKFPRHD